MLVLAVSAVLRSEEPWERACCCRFLEGVHVCVRRVAEKSESFAELHLTEAWFQLWRSASSTFGVGVAVGAHKLAFWNMCDVCVASEVCARTVLISALLYVGVRV